MTANAAVRVSGEGLWMPPLDGEEPLPSLPVDLGRLRRMDRFGRSGFLAGGLALASAGQGVRTPPDPKLGVVFGTAHGCRDSLIDFTLEIAAATSVEGLSPALFAETVHNTVNGELAIAWGLGGPSETLVSGKTGGADALVRAARLLLAGRAEAVVAGGAEGVHPRMRAWEDGSGGPMIPLREAGAALLLDLPSTPAAGDILLGPSAWFREPDPSRATVRVGSWIARVFGSTQPPLLVAATVEADATLAGPSVIRLSREIGELAGAAGAVGAVLAVRELRAGKAYAAAVVARDPDGATTVLGFFAPSYSQKGVNWYHWDG